LHDIEFKDAIELYETTKFNHKNPDVNSILEGVVRDLKKVMDLNHVELNLGKTPKAINNVHNDNDTDNLSSLIESKESNLVSTKNITAPTIQASESIEISTSINTSTNENENNTTNTN